MSEAITCSLSLVIHGDTLRLNCTVNRFVVSSIVREDLERHGADLAEVKRLWQEVMAVFWFMDPDCAFFAKGRIELVA
jgi:hypothetical protein